MRVEVRELTRVAFVVAQDGQPHRRTVKVIKLVPQ